MSELAGKLLEFIAAIRDTFLFFTVVEAWEKGVVLRLGKPVRDVGPGLRWHWPFHVERVVVTSCAWETADLPPQSLATSDGAEVAISAVLTYRVTDARKFLIKVGGEDSVLADSSRGVIRRVVGEHTWDELQSQDVDVKISKAVRDRAWRWGIEVREAQLSDLTTAKCYRILGSGMVFEESE